MKSVSGNTLTIYDRNWNCVADWEIDPVCPDSIDLQNIRLPRKSEWGEIQDGLILAKGIYLVGTPSHGGIMVDRRRWGKYLSEEAKRISAPFEVHSYYSFEEDCNWALVLDELLEQGIDLVPTYMRKRENIRQTIRERAKEVLDFYSRRTGQ